MANAILNKWLEDHRHYGLQVTSHDLIKSLAVVIMIVDHLGYLFFPHQEWWRAVGRIGFPVWFFFAGYSRKGEMSWVLLPGMVVIAAAKCASGLPLFPINALLTIFLIRFMNIYIPLKFYRSNIVNMLALALLALLLSPVSNLVFEYGTIGLLFGYLGFIVRNDPEGADRRLFAMICLGIFIIDQAKMINWSFPAACFMACGTAATLYWLYNFRNIAYPQNAFFRLFGPSLRGLGRHTLLIYVVHLVFFAFLRSALVQAGIL